MAVTETFTLGKGTSSVEFHLWSPEVVSRLKGQNLSVSVILFGINTMDEWNQAGDLDADATYTDTPCEILKFKNAVQTSHAR